MSILCFIYHLFQNKVHLFGRFCDPTMRNLNTVPADIMSKEPYPWHTFRRSEDSMTAPRVRWLTATIKSMR